MKLSPTIDTNLIKYTRPLIASVLIVGGLLSSIDSTIAATAPLIRNQSTVTYEDPLFPADPKDPTDKNRISTSSNIIDILAQEVAGININPKRLNR